ncbi:MAG: hypothetical protein K1X72_17955 [Pyrinomonadaceae bacterium]|nr:hypothetical protein [Pyrinomonadaceae bacterium]
MKKFLIGLMMLFVFAVTVPLEASAQTCRVRSRSYTSRNYFNGNSYSAPRRGNRVKRFFQNRNVRNIALATGGGALLGGILGGRRTSMLKGAIIGAGAGALYTYVLKPRRNYR